MGSPIIIRIWIHGKNKVDSFYFAFKINSDSFQESAEKGKYSTCIKCLGHCVGIHVDFFTFTLRGNCGDDPDGMLGEVGPVISFARRTVHSTGKWVNERRSRYNVRLRILSEWHFCHGDVSRSSLLDFIAYPKFLAHPSPWCTVRCTAAVSAAISDLLRARHVQCRIAVECRTHLTCIIRYKGAWDRQN